MEVRFRDVMSKQTNSSMLKIINSPPGDYQIDAVDAAKKEVQSTEQRSTLRRRLSVIRGIGLFTYKYISNPKNYTDHLEIDQIFSVEINLLNGNRNFKINNAYYNEVKNY